MGDFNKVVALTLKELGLPRILDSREVRYFRSVAYFIPLVGDFKWYGSSVHSDTLTEAIQSVRYSGESIDDHLNETTRQRIRQVKGLLEVPEGVTLSKADWANLLIRVQDFIRRNRPVEPKVIEASLKRDEDQPHLSLFVRQAIEALRVRGFLDWNTRDPD